MKVWTLNWLDFIFIPLFLLFGAGSLSRSSLSVSKLQPHSQNTIVEHNGISTFLVTSYCACFVDFSLCFWAPFLFSPPFRFRPPPLPPNIGPYPHPILLLRLLIALHSIPSVHFCLF